MMIQKITREEEARIPAFQSHQEAREWFERKYKDAFILIGSEAAGSQKCFFYDLILNRKEYEEGQRQLRSGQMKDALRFLNAYQNIQIFEDGSVHIVH